MATDDDYDSEEDEDYVGGNGDSEDGGSNTDSDSDDSEGDGKRKKKRKKLSSSTATAAKIGSGKGGSRKRGRTDDLEAIDADEINALREEVIEAYGAEILKDNDTTATDTTTTTGRQGYLNSVYDTLVKEVQEQYNLYANGKPSRFNQLVTYLQEQYQKSSPSMTDTATTTTTTGMPSLSLSSSSFVPSSSSSLTLSSDTKHALPSNIYAIGTTAGPGQLSNRTKRSKDSVSYTIPRSVPAASVTVYQEILQIIRTIQQSSSSSSSSSSTTSTHSSIDTVHPLLDKLLYLLTNTALSDGCISGIPIHASSVPLSSYFPHSTTYHNNSYQNNGYNGGVNIVAVPPPPQVKVSGKSIKSSRVPGLAYLRRLSSSSLPDTLNDTSFLLSSTSTPIPEYTIDEQNQIISSSSFSSLSSSQSLTMDETIRRTALKSIANEALARTQNKKMAITRTVKFAGKTQTITEYVDPGSQAARSAMEAAANAAIRNTLATMDKDENSTAPLSSSSSSSTVRPTTATLSSTKLPPVTGTLTLNAVIDNLDKPESISTLAKTNIDWEQYKMKEGLDETFENKAAQAGFVEKQAFLSRVEERQDETDRKQRAVERRARDLANMGNTR